MRVLCFRNNFISLSLLWCGIFRVGWGETPIKKDPRRDLINKTEGRERKCTGFVNEVVNIQKNLLLDVYIGSLSLFYMRDPTDY